MEKVEKYVRIFALDALYRRLPYQFTVYKDRNGKFVTGQQDILTEKQMTGDDTITAKQKEALQMGSDPYIIDPNITYALVNGRRFDLSYVEEKGNKTYLNPKDWAEYNFFVLQPEVVFSRKENKKHVTFFYVEDQEKEAEYELTMVDLEFDAMQFVKSNTSIRRLKDIALLLNHLIKDCNIDPDVLSITRLQSEIYKQCKEHPSDVLLCKDNDGDLNAEKLFVLKALQLGEIQFSSGSYFYGKNKEKYIGDSFESVLSWIRSKDNATSVQRLGKLVSDYDKKEV
jgi:hypothetical protein